MVRAHPVLAVQHAVLNTGYGRPRSGRGIRSSPRGAGIRQRSPAAASRSVTALRECTQEERQVGRTLGEPAHEVAVPLGAEGHVHPYLITGRGEPALFVVADAI